jgi:hypothetical protein
MKVTSVGASGLPWLKMCPPWPWLRILPLPPLPTHPHREVGVSWHRKESFMPFFLDHVILHNLPTMIVYSYNGVQNVCLLNTIFILFNLLNLPPMTLMSWWNALTLACELCWVYHVACLTSYPAYRAKGFNHSKLLNGSSWPSEVGAIMNQHPVANHEKDGWCVAACNNLWQNYTLS